MSSSPFKPGSSHAYRKFQDDFLKWAISQVATVEPLKPCALDIADIAQLLQALGFHIRNVDVCPPEETTSLKNNQKGVRVIMSCNHSGQRFYLEKPVMAENCNCVKITDEESKDCLWEITASNPTEYQNAVVETGTDLIPSIDKDLRLFISTILHHLIYLTHNADESNSEPVAITVSAPSPDSQIKYRSLDTLISKDATAVRFPEPSYLYSNYFTSKSNLGATCSSPNIHLDVTRSNNRINSTSSTIYEECCTEPSKALSLLKDASKSIADAIALIEANTLNASSESVFENKNTTNLSSESVFESTTTNLVQDKPVSKSDTTKFPITRTVSSPSLSRSSTVVITKAQDKSSITRPPSKPSSNTADAKNASKPSLKSRSSIALKSVSNLTNAPNKSNITRVPLKSSSSSTKDAKNVDKSPLKSKSSTCLKSVSNLADEKKDGLTRSPSMSSIGNNKSKVSTSKADFKLPSTMKRTTKDLYAHIKSTIPKPAKKTE